MANYFLMGFCGFLVFAFTLYRIYKIIFISIEERTECFLLSHGEVRKVYAQAGLQIVWQNLFPWVSLLHVSKNLQCLKLKEIQINDRHGTTLTIDLWIEYKISDPYKALFVVEDWNSALRSVIIHSATSILSSLEFADILKQRTELETLLQKELRHETERWGLNIEGAMIQNISLLPEVSQQLFDLVAARIEKSKALIQEQGRLAVLELEAAIQLEISKLKANAESQNILYLNNFYSHLSRTPKTLKAFQEYLVLQSTDSSKLVAFGNGTHLSMDKMLEATQIIDAVATGVGKN